MGKENQENQENQVDQEFKPFWYEYIVVVALAVIILAIIWDSF